jgi:ribosomal protein S18 acetylase RimI-like enzyme
MTPPGRTITRASALAVRPADPADADVAAALILEPIPSLIDLLHSEEVAFRVARASFLAERSLHSYRFASVAMEGGHLIGLVVAVPGAEFPRLRRWTGLVMLWAGLARARALIRAGGVVDRLTPPVPADSVYVSSLAVAPHRRSGGAGTALMAHVEAEARRRGIARVTLDVNRDNARGRAFYRRLGFLETGRRISSTDERRRVATTGFLRLEKRFAVTAAAA